MAANNKRVRGRRKGERVYLDNVGYVGNVRYLEGARVRKHKNLEKRICEVLPALWMDSAVSGSIQRPSLPPKYASPKGVTRAAEMLVRGAGKKVQASTTLSPVVAARIATLLYKAKQQRLNDATRTPTLLYSPGHLMEL